MPEITIMPDNITVDLPRGSLLLDAARLAGVTVEVPCGGKGVCGKCLVRIETGCVEIDGKIIIEQKDHETDGVYVMACRAKMTDIPVTFTVSSGIKTEQGKFSNHIEDLHLIDQSLLPGKEEIEFFIKKTQINILSPKAGDGLSDLDRLRNVVLKNTENQGGEGTCVDVKIPLAVLTNLPELLRQANGDICLIYYIENKIVYIVDIKAGKSNDCKMYGLAIDIGTTTVAAILTDEAGDIIAEKTAYNQQIECGFDVISRINYAKNKQRQKELRDKVLKTINSLISDFTTEDSGICNCDIYNVSIAANTTMVHLLLGIVPEYIRLDPYTPAVYSVPLVRAGDVGIEVAPDSAIYIAPSVGSYVGGDITSGILCTRLAAKEPSDQEICMFIDIGTNGEMILGNEDFLLGCACSAGPAFEGGGIKYGMRASNGAIEHIKIDAETGEPACTVIGDTTPVGICGSGMISLIAELLNNGFLSPDGKLAGKQSKYIIKEGRNSQFVLAYMSDSAQKNAENSMLTVSEADIDNFIRAKAAIFSACRIMLKNVGIDFVDLSKIYIAGGFGRYLDIVNSKTIGLFPDIPFEKFCFIGNSSLIGAYMTLVSANHKQKQTEIANKITYIDLSAEPGYMDEYTAALFLPDTDFSIFNSKI